MREEEFKVGGIYDIESHPKIDTRYRGYGWTWDGTVFTDELQIERLLRLIRISHDNGPGNTIMVFIPNDVADKCDERGMLMSKGKRKRAVEYKAQHCPLAAITRAVCHGWVETVVTTTTQFIVNADPNRGTL